VWGSTAILAGLPIISGREGDGALEGPGSVEVVPFSSLSSGAALTPDGAAVAVEGASRVVVVLAIVGEAGAAPVVSGVPPTLGGSVVLGAVAAPGADGASVDARSSSSLAARGGVAGVAVAAGSGPGVVWPVFLFFLIFFSSFFSSAYLERRGEKEVRGFCAGTLTRHHTPPILSCPEGQRGRWRRGGFSGRLLSMGGPGLGSPAGAFIVELGVALHLQAGLAPLLLQVSRGGRVNVPPGGLVRQGGVSVGGV
jgi:hypothetical protein